MRHKPDITRDAAVSLLLLRDSSLERRVLKILDMVETGTTFAIRELAAEFRLSPAYLQRLFKNETGICMGEWLSEQRLQRAAYLLSNSYLSIKEITHAIGYEHTSSFIRAFERRFLQAPARYRKQNKRKYDAQGDKRFHAA
ncbi:MAG TPA: helix-turn-helix transcriptional regulator [Steroidobacteraceae bacterium]|jgi:AraC-like DNA-binding protein|nr:helix-turn-helix transcriptional regulator [Steroidobacteraceae bacterium]